MLEVIDGPTTSLPAGSSAAGDLVGAVLCDATYERGERLPERFETFPRLQLSKFLDEADTIVHGRTTQIIELELNNKYKSPPGTTRVLCLQTYSTGGTSGYYNSPKVGRWVILPKPLVRVSETDPVGEISTWIAGLKSAVLVDIGNLPTHLRSEDVWRSMGYSCRSGGHGLYVLNFSPRAAANTVYKKEKAVYDELMRGYLDIGALGCIIRCMSPPVWPWKWNGKYRDRSWRLKRVLGEGSALTNLGEAYKHADEDFTYALRELDEIETSLELCKKILPRSKYGWWRKTGDYSRALERLVIHLHGVEQRVKKLKRNRKRMQKLCDWIRSECKAMKIRIPQPPVEPKLNVQTKSKPKPKKGKREPAPRTL